MELLVAQRLTHLVGGTELLADVNLRLATGDRVGLVGPNGSGKSTLLRLLAGHLAPESGRLVRAPGVRVGYLPQTTGRFTQDETVWQFASRALTVVRELESRMREAERQAAAGRLQPDVYARLQAEFERAGGFGAEAALRRELAAVGFHPADDGRMVSRLSPGERRRLALATALAEGSDLLLLDEPTNHLDISARVRLGRRLAAWRGALVVVSHDRALLDESTNRTAFLEVPRAEDAPHRLVLETGAYTVAHARRQGTIRASHKRERERAKEAARLEAMAAELARFGKKATARKRAAQRELQGIRLRQMAGQRESAADGSGSPPRLAQVGGSGGKRAGHTLLEAKALSSPPVLQLVSLQLGRGDRVALLGPNGSGKSTLLSLLAGTRPSTDPGSELRFADGLRLRHVGQESRGLSKGTALWQQASDRVGSARAGRLLAEAGLDPRTWEASPANLSGGERARAGLALALTEEADVWFLDEPTNDLDLAAVEGLEEQLLRKLEASGAALVLATHDRRLAQRLTEEVWAIEDGTVVRYASVEAYLAGEGRAPVGRESSGQQPLPAGSAPSTAGEGTEEGTDVRTDVRTEEQTEVRPASAPDSQSGRSPGDPGSRRTSDPPGLQRNQEDALEDTLADLEAQRAELLRLRDEDVTLTERERGRLQALLLGVEEELMAAYAARLPAPAPSYRLMEGGYTLFAERLPAAATSGSRGERLVVVSPQPHPQCSNGGRDLGSVAAEAFAELEAAAGLVRPDVILRECAAAWLEVRLVESVGHLLFVERTEACALPTVKAALADAGARLAFTRLGAKAVQLHHPGGLPGTLLRSAGDGWWSLGLGEFLRHQGWRG